MPPKNKHNNNNSHAAPAAAAAPPAAAAAAAAQAAAPYLAADLDPLNLQVLNGGSLKEMQQFFDALLTPGTVDVAAIRDVFRTDVDTEALRAQLMQASSGTLERILGTDWASSAAIDRHTDIDFRAPSGGKDGAAGGDRRPNLTSAAIAAAMCQDQNIEYDQYLLDDPDEDASQISAMVEKLEVLPLSVLRMCVAPWRDPNTDNESVPQLCSNIVETVRYLAAVHLLTVADKFQCLPGADDRINLINNMMMSLWEGIGLLQPKIRDHVALLLGVPLPATAHEICVAVSGLGITTFFSALPLRDLRLVCDELKLLDAAPPTTDEDLLPDIYCQRLCAYFYPTLTNQPESDKCCSVRTTVHENGPGSYTCTIDNACLLSMIGQRTHVSNLFTCNKMKWRARVHVHMDSHLSFSVIQRQHPRVKTTMVLRSVSESKAKKANNAAATAGGSPGGPGQPLRLEKTMECTREEGIGFEHIVSVMEVINSTGKAPKGLYNSVEDRLSFHFTLSAEVMEMGEDPAVAQAKAAQAAAPAPPRPGAAGAEAPKLKPGMTKAQRAAVERGEDPMATAAAPATSGKKSIPKSPVTAEPTEAATPGSDVDTVSSKKKKENEKKRKALEQQEQTERERIQTAAMSSLSTTLNEATKAKAVALQRQKDRERRMELARAQPNHELQALLRTHQQNAIQARASVTKLQQEKTALDKDTAKQQQIIASRRREIEAVAEKLAAAKAAIEAAEAENSELEHERDVLLRKLESAKEDAQRVSQLKDILAATAPLPPTKSSAAISDMSTFWQTHNDATHTPTSSGFGGSFSSPAIGQPQTSAPLQFSSYSGYGTSPPMQPAPYSMNPAAYAFHPPQLQAPQGPPYGGGGGLPHHHMMHPTSHPHAAAMHHQQQQQHHHQQHHHHHHHHLHMHPLAHQPHHLGGSMMNSPLHAYGAPPGQYQPWGGS